MVSLVDQKRAFNKLKHDLEPWRNLLVQLDSILNWDKPYYPAALFGGITLFYLILWELELSTITLLAMTGLFFLAFDFGYPMMARMLYKQDNWTGAQEASYEHICQQICTIKHYFQAFYNFWFSSPEPKSSLVVGVVTLLLLLLAWIGSAFDNMFLMYFITITLALMPGIMQKSVVESFMHKVGSVVTAQADNIRQRSAHTKAE